MAVRDANQGSMMARPIEDSPRQPPRWRGPITIEIGAGTILLLVGVVVAAYLLFRIPHFWLIVLTAVVLATAMDKPVAALSQKGVPRPLAILLIYLLLIALLAGALAALAPIIAGDARALQAELPGYTSRLEQLAASLPTNVQGGNQFSLSVKWRPRPRAMSPAWRGASPRSASSSGAPSSTSLSPWS